MRGQTIESLIGRSALRAKHARSRAEKRAAEHTPAPTDGRFDERRAGVVERALAAGERALKLARRLAAFVALFAALLVAHATEGVQGALVGLFGVGALGSVPRKTATALPFAVLAAVVAAWV